MKIETESTWENRAETSIAQGALTNSKNPRSLVKGVYPSHLKNGRGPYVWDTNGKKYIDLIAGLGSNLFGYCHPEIDGAVINAISDGVCLSLSSTLEVKAAEQLKAFIPFIDRVKFVKTGTEACMAAARIARAYTGKNDIYSTGYHGWSDPFVSLSEPAAGVPKFSGVNNHCVSKYRKLDCINNYTAALIMEPIEIDYTTERVTELKKIKAKCKETETLLIYDEIITGFRFTKKCVSLATKIRPDLLCLGKAIANGYPLGLVAGKAEIMDNDKYFVSGTYAGERIGLAALLKSIQLLRNKYDLEYLWTKANYFRDRFNTEGRGVIWLEGYGTRNVLKAKSDVEKAIFMQECCKAGILLGPSVFYNFSHFEVEDNILGSVRDVINRMQGGMTKLEGELPVSPFAQEVRKNGRIGNRRIKRYSQKI